MALIPAQLYPALYKGVQFLIQGHTLTAGRKTVTHEYPNSDIRVVEDLGALPDKFTITGLTTGGNYKNARDNLIAALNSKGPGQLVHPFFGTIEVTATTYTLNETTNNLNVAVFTMNFERSQANVFPTFSGQNISLINQLAILIADLMNTDIANLFIVSPGYPQNFKDAVALLQGIAAIFEGLRIPFETVGDTLAVYKTAVENFSNNINNNIANPSQLADDTQNLFYLADSLSNDPIEKLLIAEQFFYTNINSPEIEPTTVQRIERLQNRFIMNEAVNTYSLINAYNAFAKNIYTRYTQLEDDFILLEEQYNYLIDNYSPDGNTLDTLKDLRVQARIVFDSQKTNVRYLIPIITAPNTLRNVCYLLYGNTNDLNELISLNNITNPARVEGELLVLSQ